MGKLKVIIVIPARWNSSRFPGKPLVQIHGTSMINRVIYQCRQLICYNIVVATDDERIEKEVQKMYPNVPVIMTSPNHMCGMERVAEVGRGYGPDDYLINVQGDIPFISPLIIDRVIQTIVKGDFDVVTPVERSPKCRITDKNVVKVVFDNDLMVMFFSRLPIRYEMYWYRHIGVYGYRNEVLQDIANRPSTSIEKYEKLEQLRFMEYGVKIKIVLVEDGAGPEINTPEDLERAKELK